MSWKLAEWRWREQAPLKERSLWKIWDAEDALKNGDVVEEAVRFAYHYPDQVNDYWQNHVGMPPGGRLGSIRSGTNPYPPPRTQLPELPSQHHTSYHPLRSLCTPLLIPLGQSFSASGESTSTSLSISSLISQSISSTPTVSATPRTPQVVKDFLGSRDWNHLALDQKVDRNTAVAQLRSSFGLFARAAQGSRSAQQRQFVSRYHQPERDNTSASPTQHISSSRGFGFHRLYESKRDLQASVNGSEDRAIPWSNLVTVSEDQQLLVKKLFQHSDSIFEVLNPADSVIPRSCQEEPSDSYHSSYNSSCFLLPKVGMERCTDKMENDKDPEADVKHNEPPSAKVFEDLPTAYSGIVKQSGDVSKILNSDSFLDMDREHKGKEEQNVDYTYTQEGEARGDLAVPAVLCSSRHQPAGNAPAVDLPQVPVDTQRYRYQRSDIPSSGVAEYDDTKSLLKAERVDSLANSLEISGKQLLESRRKAKNTLIGKAATTETSDVGDQDFCDANSFGHELSRCGPSKPEYPSSSLGQLGASVKDTDTSATAPDHGAMKAMYDAVMRDDSGIFSAQDAIAGLGRPTKHGWTSSLHLPEDLQLSRLSSGAQTSKKDESGEAGDHGDSIKRNPDTTEWSGNAAEQDTNNDSNTKNAEGTEDDPDWETIRLSGLDSGQSSQSALQPLVEPLPTLRYKTDPRTNPSFANMSSYGTMSTGRDLPTTLWSAIPKQETRRHPALPGTPHKYRLRRNTSTGEEVYVPQYALSEGGRHSLRSDPFESAEAIPDLLATHPIPVSKFSASTPRQQALGGNTSSDPTFSSSLPVFPQGRREQNLARGCTVQEFEEDVVYETSATTSTDAAEENKRGIPQAGSIYGFASDNIVQGESIDLDNVSTSDGIEHGEQPGGMEMRNLAPARDASTRTLINITIGHGYLQNSPSQASLPSQSRLLSQGRSELNGDIFKRLSTINDDGSYDSEDDVASLSSLMRKTSPFTPRSGSFNKRTLLGAKHNITGTLRGTGMRCTGSSPANLSSDTYEPAMQRYHSYGRLSSGPESTNDALNEDNSIDITSGAAVESTGIVEYHTREQVQKAMRGKGVDVHKTAWGDVQRNVTGVIFPMGQAISAPKSLVLPRTVPPVNSFALTKDQPIQLDTATEAEVKARIGMSIDDWKRLNEPCPVFPLRDSHLDMKFTESDPRCTEDQIYNRAISRTTRTIVEDAFCFAHNRREYSEAPTLRMPPLSTEYERARTQDGRRLVWICGCVPLLGWIVLYYLWKDEPGMRLDGELMRQMTGGLVQEMGEEEREFAGRALLWFVLAFVGVTLAGLIALVCTLL